MPIFARLAVQVIGHLWQRHKIEEAREKARREIQYYLVKAFQAFAASVKVEVKGDTELMAAFRGMDRDMRTELRKLLKEIAGDVAKDAQARAPVRTGTLRKSIRPSARANAKGYSASVRVTARKADFLYGYVVEARQPFLGPAATAELVKAGFGR